jgi:hypothetical protein
MVPFMLEKHDTCGIRKKLEKIRLYQGCPLWFGFQCPVKRILVAQIWKYVEAIFRHNA